MNLHLSGCTCPVTCQPCGMDNDNGSFGSFCSIVNGDCPSTYSVSFSVDSVTDPVTSITVPAYSGSNSPTEVAGNNCKYRFEGAKEAVTTSSGTMDRQIIIDLHTGGSAIHFPSFSSPCAVSNGGAINSACFGINVICSLGYYDSAYPFLLRFVHIAIFALKKYDIEDDCSEEVPCYTALNNVTPHWSEEYPTGLNGSYDGIE